MSISSITGTTNLAQTWQSLAQQRQQDFNSLSQALESGNLAGAQQAYANLQSLLPNSQTGLNTTNSTSTNPIQSDFASLGQALASGNLSQAQSAFAQLKNDLTSANPTTSLPQTGSVHGHHHHHHGGSSTQSSSSTTDSNTTDNSQSNGVNVTA